MTFPTFVKIKSVISGSIRMLLGHWPISIVLLIAYLTSLWAHDSASDVVLTVGALGAIIFLPLVKQEKNYWLYIATFFLCIINDINLEQARYIADLVGFDWMTSWVAWMILIAVQGSVAAFVYLLLLYLFVFRLQGSASLLFKIPLCVLFLIAALGPACVMLWLFLGLTGIFGPI